MKFSYFLIGLTLFLFKTPPSVSAQKNVDFNGRWYGISTVDYGFGIRDKCEYELILQNKKGVISGYSITTITHKGKKYIAKAAIEGTAKGTYLKSQETKNIYEDPLPQSVWIPFQKMEMIFKMEGNTPVLEGLYKCKDDMSGRILLKKKPPQV